MSKEAIDILHAAVIPQGILASTQPVSNYQRVWARDSVICGIAGLVAQDAVVIAGLEASLKALGDQQTPQGHIPSNVQFGENGETSNVSYGGLCGRVDANTWWIIGLGLMAQQVDHPLMKEYEEKVEKTIQLLQAWEFNNKGFLYVPQSGNWADEYILSGYTLYDQLLYYWALKLAGQQLQRKDWTEKSIALKKMIQHNFWIEETLQTDFYHPNAFMRKLENGESQYWEACLSPGGYIEKFDLLGNALAILLGFSRAEQSEKTIDYALSTTVYANQKLLPSFYPVIERDDPEWFLLASNYAYEFRNLPYEFQNAGIWPAFNAWFGAAMVAANRETEAADLLAQIASANQKRDGGFYECIHGKNGAAHGTKHCTWSAAGEVLLDQLLINKDFSLWK